jgi:calcium/calmodulin-dependent protein kinase kinase 1
VLCQRVCFADPGDRITLQAAAEHPWVAGDKGPVPGYMCRCGFDRRKRNDFQEQVQ